MKKKLIVLASLIILCASLFALFTVSTSAATEGYYTYTVSNGEATITDVDTSISGNVIIPSTLGGYPVTSIGSWAFSSCTGLKAITIPESVVSIGGYAFRDCTGLTQVTIGNGVTRIGDGAFYNCAGLTQVTIPESVVSIGSAAFSGCTGVGSVTVAEGNTVYHSENNCIIETGTNTLIAGFANSIIPSYVTSIGSYAFYYCTGLTSITIPESVVSIGERAFYNCTGLTQVTFAEGSKLESIGSYAFDYCTGLTSITIPESVVSIGSYAFDYCTGLKLITVNSPDIAKKLTSSACGYLANYAQTVVFPTNITEIGSYVTSTFTYVDTVAQNGKLVKVYSKHSHAENATTWVATETGSVCSECGVAKGCSHDMIPATCDIPATCTLCGYEEGDALGHAFGEWQVLKAPTYTEKGTDIRICANDATHTETRETEKSGLVAEWSAGDNVVARLFAHPTATGKYVLAFVGSGNMASYNSSNTPWYEYRSDILEAYVGVGVTSIGNYTFYNCKSLMSIELPAGVTSIGSYAFYDCTGLTSIEIPESVTSIGYRAFSGCSGLTSITFAEGSKLESIGSYAFYDCTGLTSIEIPESVTSIGDSAFYDTAYYNNDSNWENGVLYIGKHLIEAKDTISGAYAIKEETVYIGDYAFRSCTGLTSIEIPESVTSIGYRAFSGCSGLTSITFAEGSKLESIGSAAFENCSGLTSIEIPEGVTSIGSSAFWGCSRLTSITFAEGSKLESIGSSAFANCTSLTSIEIPEGVTSIGSSAFANCTSLTSIEIPEGVTSIGSWTFANCTGLTSITIAEGSKLESIGDRAFELCKSLTSIAIPAGVTSIGEYTFYYCRSLTSIEIPEGVTSIDRSAFTYCTRLTSITFAEGSKLTSIGNNAFQYCDDLTSIEIPAGVTSIGDHAFAYCSGLTSITFAEGSKLESICNYAFDNCSGLTSIEIPESVTSIGKYAFSGCSGLMSIEIPEGVTSIGNHAFYNCTRLTSITFAEGSKLESIGDFAFRSCYGLTSITFAEGSKLESIGDRAFELCKSLTSIEIPEGVTSICSGAFFGCSGLTSITVENGNSVYHSEGNCLIETATNTLILGCQNSVIPSYVTSIGYSAFSYCSGLTSIEIPAGVTSIGNYAFVCCSNLTSIEIPESVTSIGEYAFSLCTSLKLVTVNSATVAKALTSYDACGYLTNYAQTVVIPATVTEIGSYVLNNFTFMDAITQNGRSVTLYSKHSHAESATTWVKTENDAVCNNCGVVTDHLHNMFPATCEAPATCTLCGYTEGEALGHDEINHDAKAPTCTEIGWNAYSTCSRCDYTTYVELLALGHAFGEWQEVKAPTYTENGVEARTCSRDASHVETRETEHPDFITEWQAGENVVARLFAHPTATGKYILAFVGEGAMASYAENKTPWRSYNNKISEVHIGNGVTSIDAFAFEGFRGLISVSVSATVTKIEGNPFVGCVSLASITVADENTVYHAEGNCLIETQANKVVSGCKTSVIPAYVTTIGASAFEGSVIKTLTFPEDSALTTIEEYAFAYCQSLDYAILPWRTGTIGAHAFSDCMAMYAVTVKNGASLANVDATAFSGCNALTLVVVESETVSRSITSKDSFGGLFANAQTVSFGAGITVISDYVKNTFAITDTLTSDGKAFTVYSKHSHSEDSHAWKDSADGKVCTDCGLSIIEAKLYGDINGDGSVTILDISALVKIASGESTK